MKTTDRNDIVIKRILESSFVLNKERGWISLLSLEGIYEIKPIDYTLYNGTAGMMFAIGIYDKAENYSEILEEILNYTQSYLLKLKKENLPISVGAFDGVYGVIYVLSILDKRRKFKDNNIVSIISQLLEDTSETVKNLDEFDIIRGLAGILAVLITVSRVYEGNAVIEEQTFPLMEFIVDKLIMTAHLDFLWVKDDIGYAHGNYGIIVQLCRYCKYFKVSHCQKQRIITLIKQLERIEKSHFIDGNMYKIRKNSQYYSWCNGVSGILLSKLYLLESLQCIDILNVKQLEVEIKELYKEIVIKGLNQDVSICHGNIGNLSILYHMDHKEGHYEQLMSRELDRLLAQKEIDNWGLMVGESGFLLSSSNQGFNKIWNLLLLEEC